MQTARHKRVMHHDSTPVTFHKNKQQSIAKESVVAGKELRWRCGAMFKMNHMPDHWGLMNIVCIPTGAKAWESVKTNFKIFVF